MIRIGFLPGAERLIAKLLFLLNCDKDTRIQTPFGFDNRTESENKKNESIVRH